MQSTINFCVIIKIPICGLDYIVIFLLQTEQS